MKFYSPLRYPGGKGKMASTFARIIRQNNLLDGVYVEPYVGGGSVALSLLFGEYVSRIIINDFDRSIFAFWHSILNQPELLCRKIVDTPVNMETWRLAKEIQQHKLDVDLLELGYSTFFLNRTNRSGIISAGVIGGNEQSGIYTMDVRFNKQELVRRIERIAHYSDRIELHMLDACDLIRQVDGRQIPKTFIYMDPPYYVKGRGLYMNYYKDADHQKIAQCVHELRHSKWVVTYDNVPFIKSLYPDFHQHEFELNYSASNSGKGREILIYSDDLLI